MNTSKERILVVESDPAVSDLISRQTLIPMGYRVMVVGAATSAIQDAVRFAPDLIIVNLNLPGLSGKDLLVAFSAQGLDVPIIVIAEKGMEGDVVQAFRLGAADFLSWPMREAEVVAAVERLLKQGRARKEKELLTRQLNQTNQELQRRVRELTTIFSIGKAVISITDLRSLFDKIVEGAVLVSEGEVGWLLIRDDRTKAYNLSAHRNLPRSITAYLNQPWDDGLSSLVALSGETLAIYGDPLKRFKVASLGQSALVTPVKVKNEVVGLLVVVRKAPQPFNNSSQALIEAVADYASIAIVNARLFRALEERARSFQQTADAALFGECIGDELLESIKRELKSATNPILVGLNVLQTGLPANQAETFQELKENIESFLNITQAMESVSLTDSSKLRQQPDLNELVRQAVRRFQPVAHKAEISLFPELSQLPIPIYASGVHILRVIDGLITNAIRYSPRGGQVTIRVEMAHDNLAHLSVHDRGPGIDEQHINTIFETPTQEVETRPTRFSGFGIRLPLARQMVNAHGGKIWAESKPGFGSVFHLLIPIGKK